ncbi:MULTISPECIES: TRAP transporter substrate-binding protein [unclassified Aminobacter]|uniref:TRAP transporter substrate-binding protein n=1 Tax=unclassified Aminobacter TaxID=2644704 RepID=UPI00046464E2|nr:MULTISPECIES: TRAP transporter substrate-binding protein [unclassified Aminobacter]TWG61362.1 TRAP-type C4-dicarboxylate transport system substrate-binding protein [Aminobacter sp. J44]TWH36635.1 TRAP-type C4-dicarboxylate transport system substrate-binding protein [Aminobacter sp. J15]
MTRKLLATLAAGAAALIVASGAAFAQSVSLTLAHQYPSTQPIGDGYNLWAKRVEELSNGDIKVQVFPGSTLIGSDESFNAVSTGSVSASNMIGGFQAGDIPELASITMPFLFDDYAHYKRAVDGGLRELVASWYEAKNIKLLSFFPKGNDQVFHKSKFLLTPEDFAGAQIRGVGGASDDVLRALGANVVRLPTTEVTQGLQRGVVDGIVTNCVAHIGRSWYEQSPYASIVSLKNDIEGLGLNLDAWNELSEEQQKIVMDAAAEMEAFEWEMMERVESKECFDNWAEKKVNVQVTTPEQKAVLKEKVASVYDDYKAKLPILEDVLKIVEAAR